MKFMQGRALAIAGFLLGLVATLSVIALCALMGSIGPVREFVDSVWYGGLLLVMISTAGAFLSFMSSSSSRVDNTIKRLDLVLNSSSFYFFSGLVLLVYALRISSNDLDVHPSLVFLLAMLGVAIMLFGTGSQATGALATSGSVLPAAVTPAAPQGNEVRPAQSTDSAHGNALDWRPLKANAAVAGGAAVLTAIFGFGVIQMREGIKEVFGSYDRYTRIRIFACASFDSICAHSQPQFRRMLPQFKLGDYNVRADLDDGTPVFLTRSGNEIQLLLFGGAISRNTPVHIAIDRISEPPKGIDQVDIIDRNVSLVLFPGSISAVSQQPVPNSQGVKETVDCIQRVGAETVVCGLAPIKGVREAKSSTSAFYSLNFYRENAETHVRRTVQDVDIQLQ